MTEDAGNGLRNVKRVILVLSGKGGVGKSTVSSYIALSLVAKGHKVGLLDVDLCGPSIPKIFGLEDSPVHQASSGWIPVYMDESQSLAVMSIGFLLKNRSDAVVWRGPKKNAMIKQFVSDVQWGSLDYLIVDTPPGTSDEHISIVETLRQFDRMNGAVLVTTPQAISVADVRREITFCKKAQVPIIGIVENMCGYTCPHCKDCSYVFSSGGGESLAKYANVPFLGRLPVDPGLTESMENGCNFFTAFADSDTAKLLHDISQQICDFNPGADVSP